MRSTLLLGLVLVLAGCPKGGGSTTTAGNGSGSGSAEPVPADEAVREGDGWSRNETPGSWIYFVEVEGDHISLGAAPGGRGMERFALPAGATGGTVSAISVAYTTPGVARWSVYADDGGRPAAAAMGAVELTITDDIAEDQNAPQYDELAFDPPVAVDGPFFLVFETVAGEPAVWAVEACCAEVYYQEPGAAEPAVVDGYVPHLAVTLSDVH